MSETAPHPDPDDTPVISAREQRFVIFAASLGTAFEWYDFYLYGSLAIVFSALFFPPGNETAALIASLATFAVGFAVRPLGALLFGSRGDRSGRKNTFLITIVLMGLSTAGVGLLPGFSAIGWLAPAALLALRVVQGLALGGEYGGASVYIAEHCEARRLGFKTSWLQTTTSLGFLLAMALVLAVRSLMATGDFAVWGWRVPFILSLPMLGVSLYIRTKLGESPVFARMRAHGALSRTPLRDIFADPANRRAMLFALFATTMPLGVVSSLASLAALVFLGGPMQMDTLDIYLVMTIALVVSTPVYVLAGWLSDYVGAARVIVGGSLLALVVIYPAFVGLERLANPGLVRFQAATPIIVSARDCHTRIFVTPAARLSSCDRAKDLLTRAGLSFTSTTAQAGQPDVTTTFAGQAITGFDPGVYKAELAKLGYPKPARLSVQAKLAIAAILAVLFGATGINSGPLSAYLTQRFAPQVRYSAVSFSYHVGNGIFGGFLPLIMSALAISTGHILGGLWYPIVLLAVAVGVGLLHLRDRQAHWPQEAG
jgi:hypothetical protein